MEKGENKKGGSEARSNQEISWCKMEWKRGKTQDTEAESLVKRDGKLLET